MSHVDIFTYIINLKSLKFGLSDVGMTEFRERTACQMTFGSKDYMSDYFWFKMAGQILRH